MKCKFRVESGWISPPYKVHCRLLKKVVDLYSFCCSCSRSVYIVDPYLHDKEKPVQLDLFNP